MHKQSQLAIDSLQHEITQLCAGKIRLCHCWCMHRRPNQL